MATKKLKEKPMTITQTVCEVFDGLQIGEEYSGYDLKRWIVKRNPSCRFTYIETYLKILRKKRRSQVLCIDPQKSIYRKVKEGK